MEAQRDRFALVAAVLPEASARILATLENNCYNYLSAGAAVLVAHKLFAFQKAEKFFSSEPL